jgi:site-specific DNA recombinase
MTRCAIYARVSTQEQTEGYSIDAQLEACRSLATARGWTVEAEYIEPGESGKTFESRPQWQAFVASARAGQFDVLVAHKIDRFSRASILDSLSALEDLRSYKVAFVSASEPIDFASPYGELLLVMTLWFARTYLVNLSAEVTKGRRKRAESGKSNANRPPFGYLRNADGDDVVDPETCDIATAAFARFARGVFGDRDIAQWLNSKGAKTLAGNDWTPNAVREMLLNPYYAGWVRYRGVREALTNLRTKRGNTRLIRGLHQPIVDQATFDRVQAIRKARYNTTGGPRPQRRVYLLQGLARCSKCGQRMKCSASAGGRLQYSCRGGVGHGDCEDFAKMVYERDLVPQVEEVLATLRVSQGVFARASALIDAQTGEDRATAARADLVAELKRLDYLFQKGRRTEAEYERESSRIEAEIADIDRALAPAPKDAGAILTGLLAAWQAAADDPASRRDILRAIFASVEIDSGRKRIVKMTPRPEFLPRTG